MVQLKFDVLKINKILLINSNELLIIIIIIKPI